MNRSASSRHTAHRLLLIAGMLLLGGCGQTGPLYLPEQSLPQEAQPAEAQGDKEAQGKEPRPEAQGAAAAEPKDKR